MTPNQLPPLPEPHIGLPWRHNAKDGSIHSSAFTWAQMHAYALAALAQQAQEPVAWIRRHPNGALSNELLIHVQVEQVRRDSGAWVPLYTTPPAPQVPAPVDERAEFEASMREKHGWEDRDFQSDSFGYFDGHTATAWLAWQARAALQSPAPQTKGQP